jgi:hypothetical protein
MVTRLHQDIGRVYHDDDIVDVPEAAFLSGGLHPVTMAIMRKDGRGPPYSRLGDLRKIVYRVGDIRAWVAKDRVVPNREMAPRTCEQARVEAEVGSNEGVEQALNDHKRATAKKQRGRA